MIERRILVPEFAELEGETLPPVDDELLDRQGVTRIYQTAKEEILGGQWPHLLQEIQELHHEVAGGDDNVGPIPPVRPLLALHAGPLEGPHEARRRIGRHVL
jgi:hypothetical protein